jgi:stage II sporulation protein D
MLGNTLLAAVASVAALNAPAAPLKQVAAPPSTVVGSSTFVVSGRGWGHGVGMSQWGAHGFARRGSAYDEILAHYYPGTALTRAAVGKVRVLLVEGASSVVVTSKSPFRVKDGLGDVFALEAGSYKIGPSLALRVRPGEPPTQLDSPLTFLRGTLPLTVKDRSYRGSIEVRRSGKKLMAINVVALEQYLYGVVPDEMPPDWPVEALKAQAVVARSYALANRRSGEFDLYADVRSQVYGGLDAEEFQATAAVDGTSRQVLTYDGRVISTPYHSTSGGRTAAATDVWAGQPVPYLVSVPDPYDSLSPHHRWGPYTFDGNMLKQRLKLSSAPVDLSAKQNASQRVSSVTATFADGSTKTIAGQTFRSDLGLRSTWFDLGVLSIAKPGAPVVFGGKATLTVVARGVKTAALEQKIEGVWQAIGTVKPAPAPFGVVVTPTASAEYRLAAGAAKTPPTRVLVAPAVRLLSPTAATALSGTVKPALDGATVVLEREEGAGWVETARAIVGGDGRFLASFAVAPGTYRARAIAFAGFAGGVSPVLRVVPA